MMKKIMMVLNQVQAGMGSDENNMLEPSAKKGAIGPGSTLESKFNEHDATIAVTFICGDKFFVENEELCTKKMVGVAKKLEIDAVLCGPAFHYPNAGEMFARAAIICNKYDVPALATMSAENEATDRYKDQVTILKMPKKGGIGLNDSFNNMAKYTSQLAHEQKNDTNLEVFCYIMYEFFLLGVSI